MKRIVVKMRCKQGFTLIELLVVVLIIGILAAVALPQYNKAVEKSEAAQALALMNTLVEAQRVYYLTHGEYATTLSQLDVDLPWTGNTKWHSGDSSSAMTADTHSNNKWTVQLYTDTSAKVYAILIGRISGPYQGAGFTYYFHNEWNANLPLNKILCYEGVSAGYAITFQQPAGSYCQKIMRGTVIPNTQSYTLP